MRRTEKGRGKGEIHSHTAIKFTNFHPSSILSLLPFLSLCLSSPFSGKCVLSLERPTGGKADGGGGWLEGNSIKPTYSSLFPHHLLSFPPPPTSPWPFCPREEPLKAEGAPTPRFSFLLPLSPLSWTQKQLVPLFPFLFPCSCGVQEEEKLRSCQQLKKERRESWEGQVAAKSHQCSVSRRRTNQVGVRHVFNQSGMHFRCECLWWNLPLLL